MFNKNKFALILKNINDTYNSQREFSKKSDINRTYLSQYMNMKLDDPPKPKTLKKLAENSNGIVTYNELMQVCGYINNDFSEIDQKRLSFLYEQLSNLDNVYFKNNLKLSLKESEIVHDLFDQVLNYLHDGKTTPSTFDPYKILNDLDFISDKSKKRIAEEIRNNFEYFYYSHEIKQEISDIKRKNIYKEEDLVNLKTKQNQYYMCPVYGRISAGQPNWAEECIEGRIPIDPELMNIINPEECFFLKVNGESMNKVIRNGSYALIRKQDIVNDGDIAVVLVNGYDATLKRFSKQGGLVILEPMSTVTDDPNIKTQVYDKNTSIKILGKYIGKFEMN